MATDFPKIWCDPRTPDQERKRILRLLIEDVTLIKDQQIQAHVRLKGGATKSLIVAKALPAWEARKTDSDVIREIDQLLDSLTIAQIVAQLNERGFRSGEKQAFTARIVARICRDYHLKCRYDRLREAGKLTLHEIAELFQSAEFQPTHGFTQNTESFRSWRLAFYACGVRSYVTRVSRREFSTSAVRWPSGTLSAKFSPKLSRSRFNRGGFVNNPVGFGPRKQPSAESRGRVCSPRHLFPECAVLSDTGPDHTR